MLEYNDNHRNNKFQRLGIMQQVVLEHRVWAGVGQRGGGRGGRIGKGRGEAGGVQVWRMSPGLGLTL